MTPAHAARAHGLFRHPGHRARRTLFAGVAALAALGPAGCVPVAPYSQEPGYYGSRDNLEAVSPAWIVAGQTRREDVLSRLGTPDVEALDHSWALYRSNYLKRESGMWSLWMFPGGLHRSVHEREIEFRRLDLGFTGDGTVASVDYARQSCSEVPLRAAAKFPTQEDVAKCQILRRDRERQDARHEARRRAAIPAGDTGVQWFDAVLFTQQKVSHMLGIDAALDCYAADAPTRTGELVISNQSVVFLPPETTYVGDTAPPVRLDRAEITDVELVNGLFDPALSIDLRSRTSGNASLSLCALDDGWRNSADRVRSVYARLREPGEGVEGLD